MAPLKAVAGINRRKLEDSAAPDLPIRYIDISGVNSLGAITDTTDLMFANAPSRARRLPEPGDTMVSTVRTYLRAIAYVAELPTDARLVCSTGFAVVTPGPALEPRFLFYWLRSDGVVDEICARSVGVSYPAINPSDFSGLPTPVPPRDVQRGLADILDRRTAAIDALIAKKERLIELLEEKRQALITQAVTKGLDPSVPMKDSGIEWLGPIPAHWKHCALRYAVVFQRGHDLPADARVEGTVPVVSSAGVIGTHSHAAARAPGIVTGRYGSIGKFHLIEEDYWPLNTALYTRSVCGNVPRFLWYALSCLQPFFLLESKKSAVPGVDRNDLHPYPVAIPPVAEQHAIATALDSACERMEALAAKTSRSVERLREYRQALITAAVTGKLDLAGPADRKLPFEAGVG